MSGLLDRLIGHDTEQWMSHPERNCARAAERGVADRWFPSGVGECADAKKLCAGCPVGNQCLAYAFEHIEVEGIWGGTTTRQRRTMRAGNRPPPRPDPAQSPAPTEHEEMAANE